eukprot:1989383-Pleurochrysis_carterae.AAC.2
MCIRDSPVSLSRAPPSALSLPLPRKPPLPPHSPPTSFSTTVSSKSTTAPHLRREIKHDEPFCDARRTDGVDRARPAHERAPVQHTQRRLLRQRHREGQKPVELLLAEVGRQTHHRAVVLAVGVLALLEEARDQRGFAPVTKLRG